MLAAAPSLTGVGSKYLNLLDHAGKAPDPDLETKVSDLCSRRCVKIVNDKVVFTTSDVFAQQLRKAHETFGTWQLEKHSRILPSMMGNSFTVKYKVNTEKCGTLVAIAMVTVDEAYRIEEIDEVYIEKVKE